MNIYERLIIAFAILLVGLAIVNVCYWIGKQINKFDDED
jgi:hypothetical protein